MTGLTFENMERRSGWLALSLSAVIMVITLGATLAWGGDDPGLARPGSDLPTLVIQGYESPQRCRECHEAEYAAWSQTTHASATFSSNFQVLLQQTAQPGECFACHTTGYNTSSGQFILAGVTCEVCHGPYRPNHPDQSMMSIATSATLCGGCHTETLAAWQSSRHGQANITCIDCHEVHTQHTRAGVATNALCAECHELELQDAVHLNHRGATIHCVDCHLPWLPVVAGEQAGNGHALLDHTFTVQDSTCTNCHVGGE